MLRGSGVDFLTRFKRILEIDKMPDEWRKSFLVPIHKGDVQSGNNYRGIKLMSYTIKI